MKTYSASIKIGANLWIATITFLALTVFYPVYSWIPKVAAGFLALQTLVVGVMAFSTALMFLAWLFTKDAVIIAQSTGKLNENFKGLHAPSQVFNAILITAMIVILGFAAGHWVLSSFFFFFYIILRVSLELLFLRVNIAQDKKTVDNS